MTAPDATTEVPAAAVGALRGLDRIAADLDSDLMVGYISTLRRVVVEMAGPGTPLARLEVVSRLAEEYGHSRYAAKPPELHLQERLAALAADNARLRALHRMVLDPRAVVTQTQTERLMRLEHAALDIRRAEEPPDAAT